MNERWLGGTLTNFNTIKKNIRQLRNLEKMEIDGTYDKITKKERLIIEKQKERLLRVLSGIAEMNKIPGAIFISDTIKDTLAVQEAKKLDIPIFAILDTNCEPDGIDYPIPGNDDSYKSIELITRSIADAILEVADKEAPEKKEEAKPKEQVKPEKQAKASKSEKPEKAPKAEKTEKKPKTEKPEKAPKAEKTEKAEKVEE
jgi:small subunit ribosomal protein S2